MSPSADYWPHAPKHQLSEKGTYFVTAGTYLKLHHFRSAERLDVLQRGLLKLTKAYNWQMEAWAIFSNHYHFIAHSPESADNAESMSAMLAELHTKTSLWLNRLEQKPKRQVWFNFRETRLTYQKSYMARLNYVHQNPVKHGIVHVANQYRWCSAGWFEETASPAMIECVYRFKTGTMNVFDDFEPVLET